MLKTEITNNKIVVVNKGDSLTLTFPINLAGGIELDKYEMAVEDRIYFAVCEPNQAFEDGVVRKILTIDDLDDKGNVIINLVPADTYYLLPGNYYYEIKLKIGDTADATIKTIIPKRKFVVC